MGELPTQGSPQEQAGIAGDQRPCTAGVESGAEPGDDRGHVGQLGYDGVDAEESRADRDPLDAGATEERDRRGGLDAGEYVPDVRREGRTDAEADHAAERAEAAEVFDRQGAGRIEAR